MSWASAASPDPVPWWGHASSPWVRDGAPPRRAEVVVVGAGVTGLAMALELQRRGVAVVIVESRGIGWGASGRNAGFLLSGVAENYATAADRYSHTQAREIWQLTRHNHELVRAILGPHAQRCGHAVTGSWNLAADAHEAIALERSATMLADDGFPAELVRRLPDPLGRYHPLGLLQPDDGHVNPVALLERMAESLELPIHCGIRITEVAPASDAVELRFDGGTIEAERVVLATNAFTPRLVACQIAPVRAQMLAAAMPPSVRACERPVYAQWGYRYWDQRGDVVLYGGCRNRHVAEEVGYGLEPTSAVQADLEAELGRIAVGGQVIARWSGTMGFTPDGLPLVGPLEEAARIWLCGGYTGHGMGFAMACAEVAASAMTESSEIPAWMRTGRAMNAAPA